MPQILIHVIKNNVVRTSKTGIAIRTGATVFNNLIYGQTGTFRGISIENPDSDSYGRQIYHNTVDLPEARAIVRVGGVSADVRNNIGPNSTTNVEAQDALFVDRGGGDYRLAAGSAPIDAGENLVATVPEDIEGGSRCHPGELQIWVLMSLGLCRRDVQSRRSFVKRRLQEHVFVGSQRTMSIGETYDRKYGDRNYFRYSEWLYYPYISALVAYCGLARGSSVLDVGCGQGFFSYLLWRNGMRVHGIDISENGIACARRSYSNTDLTFEVANIETVEFAASFDAVFVRSCSLYNTDEFRSNRLATEKLTAALKPGGTFLFLYNSKLAGRRSDTWRYHSMADVRSHFLNYQNGRCFFSSRLDAMVFGGYAFNDFFTRANMLVSRLTGVGGDIIFIFRKPELQ